MELEGRVVLVTGSSSGIGLATARAAQHEGADVFVHGLDPLQVAGAAKQLGDAPSLAIDLAIPDAGETLVEAVLAAYGRIDGVVNNAGMFPRATLAETDAAFFDRMMAVNARAPMLILRRAAAAFREQGGPGTVVNIGSVNAYAGQPDLLAYAMSKGALMTFTRNAADSLAPDGIRVNQLNLGWILTETEIETQRRAGRPDDWPSTVPKLWAPTGRLLSPDEVARQVLFWLSDASAPVTGQIYDVEQVPFLGRAVASRLI